MIHQPGRCLFSPRRRTWAVVRGVWNRSTDGIDDNLPLTTLISSYSLSFRQYSCSHSPVECFSATNHSSILDIASTLPCLHGPALRHVPERQLPHSTPSGFRQSRSHRPSVPADPTSIRSLPLEHHTPCDTSDTLQPTTSFQLPAILVHPIATVSHPPTQASPHYSHPCSSTTHPHYRPPYPEPLLDRLAHRIPQKLCPLGLSWTRHRRGLHPSPPTIPRDADQ